MRINNTIIAFALIHTVLFISQAQNATAQSSTVSGTGFTANPSPGNACNGITPTCVANAKYVRVHSFNFPGPPSTCVVGIEISWCNGSETNDNGNFNSAGVNSSGNTGDPDDNWTGAGNGYELTYDRNNRARHMDANGNITGPVGELDDIIKKCECPKNNAADVSEPLQSLEVDQYDDRSNNYNSY